MLDNYKFDFKLYKNILGKICHKTKMFISYFLLLIILSLAYHKSSLFSGARYILSPSLTSYVL